MKKRVLTLSRLDELSGALGLKQEVTNVNDIKYRKYLTDLDLKYAIENAQSISIPPSLASCPVPTIIYSPKADTSDTTQDETVQDENYPSSMEDLLSVYGSIDLSKLPGANKLMDIIDASLFRNDYYKSMYKNDEAMFKLLMLQSTVGRNYRQYFESRKRLENSENENKTKEPEKSDIVNSDTTIVFQLAMSLLTTLNSIISNSNCDSEVARALFNNLMGIIISTDPLSNAEVALPFVTRCLSNEMSNLTSQQKCSYQAVDTYNSAGYYVALGDKDGNRGKYYCGRSVTVPAEPSDSAEASVCECGKGNYQCVECSQFVFINDASGRVMTPGTSGSYVSSLYCGVTIPAERESTPSRLCSNGYQCTDCKLWQENMVERNKKTKFEATKPVLFDVSKASLIEVLQSKQNQVKRTASPLVTALQDTAKRDFLLALQAMCKGCIASRHALADEALSLLFLLAVSMKNVDLFYFVLTVLTDSSSTTLTPSCERFFFAVIDPGCAPGAKSTPFPELVKSKRKLFALLLQSLSSFILPGQFDFRNDSLVPGGNSFLSQVIDEVKGRIAALGSNSSQNDVDLLTYFVSVASASLLLLSVPQKSKEYPKLKINDKVKRGPHWHYGDIDRSYSSNSQGIVTDVSRSTVTVSWGGYSSICYYDHSTEVYTVVNTNAVESNEVRDIKVVNYIKSLDLKSIFLDIIFYCGSYLHLVESAIDALDINFKNIIVSTIDQIDVIGRFLDAIVSNNDRTVPTSFMYIMCDRLLTRVDELVLIEYCFAPCDNKGNDHTFLFLQKLIDTLFLLSSPEIHQVQNVPEETVANIKNSLSKFVQMLCIMFSVNEITSVAFPLETGSAQQAFDVSRINGLFQYLAELVATNVRKILPLLSSSRVIDATETSAATAKERFLAVLPSYEKNLFIFLFDKPNILHLTTYVANTMKLLLLQYRSLAQVEDNSSSLLGIQKQITDILEKNSVDQVAAFVAKSSEYFHEQVQEAQSVDDAPIEVIISNEVSGVRLRKHPTFDSDLDFPDGLTILKQSSKWKVSHVTDRWAKIHPSEYARIISGTDTQAEVTLDFDPAIHGFIPATSVDNIIIFKLIKSAVPLHIQLHDKFPINVRSGPEFVDATLFSPSKALLRGEKYMFDCVNDGWATISQAEYAGLNHFANSPLFCTTYEREEPLRPLIHVLKSQAPLPHLALNTNPLKLFHMEVQNIFATITRCLLEYRVSVNSSASHWLTSSLLAIRIDDNDWDGATGEKLALLSCILDEATTSPVANNIFNIMKANCKEQFQDRYYNPVTYASWAAIIWQTNLTDEVALLSTGNKEIPSVALISTWTSTNKVVRDALKQCDINDEKNGTKCFQQMCDDVLARAKLLMKFEPTNLASSDSKKYNSWLDAAFKAGLLKKTKSHIDKKISEQRDRNVVSMSTVESTLDFLLNGPPTAVILLELEAREKAANIRINAFEQSISMFMSQNLQQREAEAVNPVDGLNVVTPVDDEGQHSNMVVNEGLVSDIQRCLPLIVRRSFYDPSYIDGESKAQTYNTHYLHSLGGLPKRLHYYLTEKHSEFIKVVLTQHLESPESPRERMRSGKAVSNTSDAKKHKDVFHVMSILALLSQDYVQDDVEFLREDKVIYYLNNCLKDEELLDGNKEIFQIILKIFELISFRVCISKKLIHEREIDKDNHSSDGNGGGGNSSQDESTEVQTASLSATLLRRQPSLSDKAQDASEKILPNLVNSLFDLLFMFKSRDFLPQNSKDFIVTYPLKCSMKEVGFATAIDGSAPCVPLVHSFSTWVCVDKQSSSLHPLTKLRVVADLNVFVLAENDSAGKTPWSRIVLGTTSDGKVVVSIYDPSGKVRGMPEHDFPSTSARSGTFYCKKCGNSGPSSYTGETRCIHCNNCILCIKRAKSHTCTENSSSSSDDKYFSVVSKSKLAPYVWTHVAYAVDPKDFTLVLYVNGVEEARVPLPFTLLVTRPDARVPASEAYVEQDFQSKSMTNFMSNPSGGDANIETFSVPYAYKYEIVAEDAFLFSDVCAFYAGESFTCDPIASYSKGCFVMGNGAVGNDKKLVINNSFFQMKVKVSSRSGRNQFFVPPAGGSYKFKVKAYTFNPADYGALYGDLFQYRYHVGKGPESYNYTYADAYVAGARLDRAETSSEQIEAIKAKANEFLMDNPSDSYAKCVSALSSIHRIVDFLIQDRGVDALRVFFVGHSTYKIFSILLSLATKSFSTTIRAVATALFNKISALLPSSTQVEELLHETLLKKNVDNKEGFGSVNHYLLSAVGSHFLDIVGRRVASQSPEPSKFFVVNQYVLFFRAIMKSYSCNVESTQSQKFLASVNKAIQALQEDCAARRDAQSSEWNTVLGMLVSLCGDSNVVTFPGTRISQLHRTLVEDYTVVCFDGGSSNRLVCTSGNCATISSDPYAVASYGVNTVKFVNYKDVKSSVQVVVDSPSAIIQEVLTSSSSQALYSRLLAMTTYDEREYDILELETDQVCVEKEYESDHNYLRGDMYWNIHIPGVQTLSVSFDERTALFTDRYADFVALYRDKSDSASPIFKLNGTVLEKGKPGVDKVPPLQVTNSKDLCLHFHSNDDRDKWGFKLKVKGVVQPIKNAVPRLCDEHLLSVRYMQSLVIDTVMHPVIFSRIPWADVANYVPTIMRKLLLPLFCVKWMDASGVSLVVRPSASNVHKYGFSTTNHFGYDAASASPTSVLPIDHIASTIKSHNKSNQNFRFKEVRVVPETAERLEARLEALYSTVGVEQNQVALENPLSLLNQLYLPEMYMSSKESSTKCIDLTKEVETALDYPVDADSLAEEVEEPAAPVNEDFIRLVDQMYDIGDDEVLVDIFLSATFEDVNSLPEERRERALEIRRENGVNDPLPNAQRAAARVNTPPVGGAIPFAARGRPTGTFAASNTFNIGGAPTFNIGGAPTFNIGGAPIPFGQTPPTFGGFRAPFGGFGSGFGAPPQPPFGFSPLDASISPPNPVPVNADAPVTAATDAGVENDSSDSDGDNDESDILPYTYPGKLHSCGKAILFYRPNINCNVCSQGGTSTYTCLACEWDICTFCTEQEVKCMRSSKKQRVSKKHWQSADHIRHRFSLLFQEFVSSFSALTDKESKANDAVASDVDSANDSTAADGSAAFDNNGANAISEIYEAFVKSKYHALLCHIFDKWPRFQLIDPSFTKYIYISSRIALLENNLGSGKLLKSIKQLDRANSASSASGIKQMMKDIIMSNLNIHTESGSAGVYSYVAHSPSAARKINTISSGHKYTPNEKWLEKVFLLNANEIELEFDKRCATTNEASFVCVYRDMDKQQLLAGPFHGTAAGGNWPAEKIVLRGINCVFIAFESSEQVETDWGVRVHVQGSSAASVLDAQQLLSTPSIEIAMLFLHTLLSDTINGLKYNDASSVDCSLLHILGDHYVAGVMTGFFRIVANLQHYPADVSKQAISIVQLLVVLMKLYMKQLRGSSDENVYHRWYDYVFAVFTAFTLFAKRCIVALESLGDTVLKHSFGQLYALLPDIQEIIDSVNRMRQSNVAPSAAAVSYYNSRAVLPTFDGKSVKATVIPGDNVELGPVVSQGVEATFSQEYWLRISPEGADNVKLAIGFACTKDPAGFAPGGAASDVVYDEVVYFFRNVGKGDVLSAILAPEASTSAVETTVLTLKLFVNAVEVHSTSVPLHSNSNSPASAKEDVILPVYRRLKVFYPSQENTDSSATNKVEDDSVQVAVAFATNEIKVFNALSGTLVNTLEGHTSMVYSIAFSPDGRHILSGSFDETFRIWDASDGRVLKVVEPIKDGNVDSSVDTYRPIVVEYNAAGTRIAVGVSYNSFLVYDTTNDYALIKTVTDEVSVDITRHPFTFSSYSPDGNLYAIAYSYEDSNVNNIHEPSANYDDCSMKVWDINTGQVLCTNEGEFWISAIAFSHDSKKVAVAYVRESRDSDEEFDEGTILGCLAVYSVAAGLISGSVARQLFLTSEDVVILNTVVWSVDDQQVMCGCNNGSIQVRSSSNGESISEIHPTGSDVRNICCTDKWLAVVQPQKPGIAIRSLSDCTSGNTDQIASNICMSADNMYQLSGLAMFDYTAVKSPEKLAVATSDKVASNVIELESVMPLMASSIHSKWAPSSNTRTDFERLYSDFNFEIITDLSTQKAYLNYILGHGDVCFDNLALLGKLCELRRAQELALDSSKHTQEVSIPAAIGYFVKVLTPESRGILRLLQPHSPSLLAGQDQYEVTVDLSAAVAATEDSDTDRVFEKPIEPGNTTNILNETFYNGKNIKIEAPSAHYLNIVNATYRSGDITAKIRECVSNSNTKLLIDTIKLKSILPMAAMLDGGAIEPLYVKYEFIAVKQTSKKVRTYQHDGYYYPGSALRVTLSEGVGAVALRVVPVYAHTTLMVSKDFEVDRDRFRSHFRFSAKAVGSIRDIILKFLRETKKTNLFNVSWRTIKESLGSDGVSAIQGILSDCGHSHVECRHHHPLYCVAVNEQVPLAPDDCLAFQGYVHVILTLMSHFHNNRIYDIIDLEEQLIDGSYSHIISQCRSYLIPSRLATLCTNMLRSSAIPAKSNFTPEIEINRNEAVKRRLRNEADVDCKWSIFGQVFAAMSKMDALSLRHENRYFRVRLKNEEAYDAGGPFREIWTELANDLMSSTLPLLVKTPNNSGNVGANRHQYILNPEAFKGVENNLVTNMFVFLGKLMGMAIRSELYLEISLSSLIWKVLCDEEVTLDDYRDIAYNTIKSRIDDIRNFTNEELSELQLPFTFTSPLSVNTNNEEIPLIEGGDNVMISQANREEYIRLSTQYMLDELKPCIAAVKTGLTAVVPMRMLRLLTGKQLEDHVCGDAVINLEILKKNTRYSGFRESDELIKWFWAILTTEYSNEDIRQLIKFSWGRSRLPSSQDKYNFEICLMSSDDDKSLDGKLPIAHTCSFQIDLPRYSSREVLKEKLTFAIYNCDVMMIG